MEIFDNMGINVMEKVKNFIKNHFDFRIYPVTILTILTAFAVIPCVKILPETWGYENGILENLQMVTLGIGLFLAISAKANKKFFYFAGLIIFLLIAREVNYGRTLFFPIPGEVNAYYSWKEIKYGWLVNPIVGLYITGTVLYFIISKIYSQMWNIIKNVKFPVWNFVLLFVGMGLGEYAEKATENFVFEEISELLFYVALVGIIWLYGFNERLKD